MQTVGKTFVSETLKTNHYRLACLMRDIRNKQPVAAKVNAVWAIDVTFVTDASGKTIPVLGLIDHGSRLVVCLHTLLNKRSWTLLGHLCLAIGQYGKPKSVRTDNEMVFTSRVFRTLLYLTGIRHQRTQIGAPWQNGRIERFFGTLKPLLRQLTISGAASLQLALDEFVLFYNHVRPHQNLSGLTPAEAWQGLRPVDIWQAKHHTGLPTHKPQQFVQAMDYWWGITYAGSCACLLL
jgi:putative transposase